MATLTDYAEVTYDDGHQQRWEMQDIRIQSTKFQQTPQIVINNVDGRIKKAIVRCAAATPAYILSVYIKGQ
jgi:hypothetical protein